MTGFDETVPPDDITEDADATSADDATDNTTDNVVKPTGAPAQTDADDERPAEPFGGDDDIASGHRG